MEKDISKVEKIESFDNQNLISSSQNIVINNFSEEVDKFEVCDEINMVSFIDQNFLSG